MYGGTEAGSGVGSRGDQKGLRLEAGNLRRPHQLSRPEVVAFGMGQRIPGRHWFQRVKKGRVERIWPLIGCQAEREES